MSKVVLITGASSGIGKSIGVFSQKKDLKFTELLGIQKTTLIIQNFHY